MGNVLPRPECLSGPKDKRKWRKSSCPMPSIAMTPYLRQSLLHSQLQRGPTHPSKCHGFVCDWILHPVLHLDNINFNRQLKVHIYKNIFIGIFFYYEINLNHGLNIFLVSGRWLQWSYMRKKKIIIQRVIVHFCNTHLCACIMWLCVSERKWKWSRSVVPDSLRPQRALEWVAIAFSRGIFRTQGLNPGLPHCRQTLLPSEPPGKSGDCGYKVLKIHSKILMVFSAWRSG